MTFDDATLELLRGHLDDLAADGLATLVEEARVEAQAKVRAMLVEAIAERMLARAEAFLGGDADDRDRGRAREREAGPRGESAPPQEGAVTRSRSVAADADTAAAHARADTRTRADEPLGWYVYGVVAEDCGQSEDLLGIDGEHPVTIVPAEGIAAVASRVPLSEFGEHVLSEQVNDLEWLERTARRHDSILDRIREHTTLVPMRLCTIYNTDASVREMLAREHEFLVDALERLDGRTEWGVKLFANGSLPNPERDGSAKPDEKARGAGPGAAYMVQKRMEGMREAEAETLLDESCAAIHLRLCAAAVEAKLNPLQARELTKRDEQMLLNGVYLVEDRASGEFAATVASLREEHETRGIGVELTGPWPPYNFVNDGTELGR